MVNKPRSVGTYCQCCGAEAGKPHHDRAVESRRIQRVTWSEVDGKYLCDACRNGADELRKDSPDFRMGDPTRILRVRGQATLPKLTKRELSALVALAAIAEAGPEGEGDYNGFDYKAMNSAITRLQGREPDTDTSPAGLLLEAAEAQKAYWDALKALEAELDIEIDDAADLDGMTVEELIEACKTEED